MRDGCTQVIGEKAEQPRARELSLETQLLDQPQSRAVGHEPLGEVGEVLEVGEVAPEQVGQRTVCHLANQAVGALRQTGRQGRRQLERTESDDELRGRAPGAGSILPVTQALLEEPVPQGRVLTSQLDREASGGFQASGLALGAARVRNADRNRSRGGGVQGEVEVRPRRDRHGRIEQRRLDLVCADFGLGQRLRRVHEDLGGDFRDHHRVRGVLQHREGAHAESAEEERLPGFPGPGRPTASVETRLLVRGLLLGLRNPFGLGRAFELGTRERARRARGS